MIFIFLLLNFFFDFGWIGKKNIIKCSGLFRFRSYVRRKIYIIFEFGFVCKKSGSFFSVIDRFFLGRSIGV